MTWTAPRTWVVNEVVSASIMNVHVRDNFKALGDAWTAYSPSWTATTTNPTIGNGSLVGAFAQAGKLTFFRAAVNFGTTTTFGSGAYLLSLPASAVAGQKWSFEGWALQTNTYKLFGHVAVAGGSTAQLYYISNGTTSQVSNVGPTAPTTWTATAGNGIYIAGVFEAA
jgi:hypothetical protein